MGIKTFAAINVGSYELSMKIYEFSGKGSMKEVDYVRHRIDLGSDTYATGKISNERVDELSRVLREFTTIMKAYRIEDYKAYATSAIRETENRLIILDQIRQRVGIDVEVLSNSEQRFLDYKSIASKGEGFNKIIEQGTAIVDIGGGSIQISLFDRDTLVTTQNLRLGVLRIRDSLARLNPKPMQTEELIDEMVSAQLSVFKKLYLKEREIKNIIVVDDYLSLWVAGQKNGASAAGYADSESYERFMEFLRSKTTEQISSALKISEENVPLFFISAVIMKRMIKMMEAELIWAPGVTICDGMAYEYAESHKIIKCDHDFEQDIIACARNISKRYMGSKKRAETLEKLTMTIFDSMKKVHGLSERERLYLRIAALLHDCGKYISLVNLGECSYQIIMATEIIGLSHIEREIIANVVMYNHCDFQYYDQVRQYSSLDKHAYLTVAKLTAILKLANGLDRSHKQKFKDVKTVLKGDELILTVDTMENITLEKGLFDHRAAFFEEVYSVKPVIRQKRKV